MNIIIKNLHNEQPTAPWQVKVDRTSPLGNPFPMRNEKERNQVCSDYEQYFTKKIYEKDPLYLKELNRLIELYKKYGKLELFCWCAPKRCHAQTIQLYLIEEGDKP